jgi:hypothetical protein
MNDTTLHIGEYDNPLVIDFIRLNFSKNPIIKIVSYDEFLNKSEIDFLFWSLDKASAFARSYEGFTAVVPKNLGPPFLMVYYMPHGAESLTYYINQWLELKRYDGTSGNFKNHWISGNQPVTEKKRWCVLRDVLHILK